MDNGEVIQVGNIVDDSKVGFKNPQRGRIYSIEGLAPCLNCCGGGQLEPKIVVYEENENPSSDKEGIYRNNYGGVFDASYPTSKTRRGRVQEGGEICPTITCNCEGLRRIEDMTDTTICLNSKVDGKQPSVADRIYSTDGCSVAITSGWKQNIAEPIICAMRGRNPDNPNERGKSNGNYKQRFEPNESGTSNTITSVQKDNYVVEPHYRIRKLTPRECFRLMGVDDADIDKIQGAGISNSQMYKLAGNSIVVDTLYHLMRKMFCETNPETQQPTLF